LREALRTSPLTACFSIEPVVREGVAELRGGASYDAQLAAIEIARAIDSIRDVANDVEVTP
jgi:osmotically-inducible protein OsmY